MPINLKKLREVAGLSQVQLAQDLGVSQSQLSRFEANPDEVPLGLLERWLTRLGTTLKDAPVEAADPPSALDVGDPYGPMREQLELLEDYCAKAARTLLAQAVPLAGTASADELLHLARRLRRKPNVLLTGQFDAGKSRLANSFLGGTDLPTAWQPATRLVTFVRHIDDRPRWMLDASVEEYVWILGPAFDHLTGWESREAWERNRITVGNLVTLRDYGTHGGSHGTTEAAFAVVFLDAPLLKACNLIDLPGAGSESEDADRDAQRARSAYPLADVAIYLCQAIGFLKAPDMAHLSYVLRTLPSYEASDPGFATLGNLFVVATHAAGHLADGDLQQIIDRACDRFFKDYGGTVFEEWSARSGRRVTKADLRARFFSFWHEIEERRRPLHEALASLLLNGMPRALTRRMATGLAEFKARATDTLREQVESFEQMCSDLDDARREYERLKNLEGSRKAKMEQLRAKVLATIDQSEKESLEELRALYQRTIDADRLEVMIREQYGKDAKEARTYAATYTVELLQAGVGEIIGSRSKAFDNSLNQYIAHYRRARAKDENAAMPAIEIPFDARGAFLGGVAGAGTLGALAAWAASLGNLGTYILVAKGVSVLSALGITIPGGTAAVMSFIASVGGPVTLAVGIFAAAGFAIWSLFGDSWEKRLARKLEKSLHEAGLLKKMTQAVETYWADTRQAFIAGADAMERQYVERLEQYRALVAERATSQTKVEAQLQHARALRDFFAQAPIRPFS